MVGNRSRTRMNYFSRRKFKIRRAECDKNNDSVWSVYATGLTACSLAAF